MRMETFMKKVGKDIINSGVQSGASLSDMIWKLQTALCDFIAPLESAVCIETWRIAIFMKYCSHELISRDGVPIGDFAVLKVKGCDWLTF